MQKRKMAKSKSEQISEQKPDQKPAKERSEKPKENPSMILRLALLFGFIITISLYFYKNPIESKMIVQHIHTNQKIIAVGDLHGDLPNTLKTFKMAGLIDDQGNWAAGNSIFVQTGDVVDRGPDTIELYKLMQKLIVQAKEKGGQVIQLLGNHEVMNLANDLRYVTPEDFDSFGGFEERKQAWSKTGWIGQYLRTLGVAAWVEGTVFFHGGAHPNWSRLTVDGMNQETKKALQQLDPEELYRVGLFGNDGPLWYRGYALAPESKVCQVLDSALELMNATRMVIGHTPQLDGKILSRCEHKVFVVDVGISRVYGGNSAALEIQGSQVTALYPNKRVVLSK
jgi:hypothetical protein